MSIYHTCAFSGMPILEEQKVIIIFLQKNKNKISASYTNPWDMFYILGFPLKATFISRSDFQFENKDEKIFLSEIFKNEDSLSNITKKIIQDEYLLDENDPVSFILIEENIFNMLKPEKRARNIQLESSFREQEEGCDKLDFNSSLKENISIFKELHKKSTEVFNKENKEFLDEVFSDKGSIDDKYFSKSRYIIDQYNCPFKGLDFYYQNFKDLNNAEYYAEKFTELLMIISIFDKYRKIFTPSLHSFENRNFLELANMYRRLANEIEVSRSIDDEDILDIKIEDNYRYILKEKDLLNFLDDYEEDFANEIISSYRSYDKGDYYIIVPTKIVNIGDFPLYQMEGIIELDKTKEIWIKK